MQSYTVGLCVSELNIRQSFKRGIFVVWFLLSAHIVQGIHANCHRSSSCHNSGCSGNKKVITDDMTAAAYEKKLRSTVIFRNLESFCWVCTEAMQCCNYLQLVSLTVSGYILGGIFQLSAVDIPSRTGSLWLNDFPHVNAFGFSWYGNAYISIYVVYFSRNGLHVVFLFFFFFSFSFSFL